MDFNEALSAHLKWKALLRSRIDGPNGESLEPESAGRDDQCDLGRWMHSEASRPMWEKPQFQVLKQLHADFHAEAETVLAKVVAGDRKGATHHLNSAFFEASSRVVQAMLACQEACE